MSTLVVFFFKLLTTRLTLFNNREVCRVENLRNRQTARDRQAGGQVVLRREVALEETTRLLGSSGVVRFAKAS